MPLSLYFLSLLQLAMTWLGEVGKSELALTCSSVAFASSNKCIIIIWMSWEDCWTGNAAVVVKVLCITFLIFAFKMLIRYITMFFPVHFRYVLWLLPVNAFFLNVQIMLPHCDALLIHYIGYMPIALLLYNSIDAVANVICSQYLTFYLLWSNK